MNPAEKVLQKFKEIPEKIRAAQDMNAKDIDQFLNFIELKKPTHVNIIVIETHLEKDAAKLYGLGEIERYDYTTQFSFQIKPQSSNIANLIESYRDSTLLVKPREFFNPFSVNEMKIRGVLTAANRQRRIKSKYPELPILMYMKDEKGLKKIDEEELRLTEINAKGLRISPFII